MTRLPAFLLFLCCYLTAVAVARGWTAELGYPQAGRLILLACLLGGLPGFLVFVASFIREDIEEPAAEPAEALPLPEPLAVAS